MRKRRTWLIMIMVYIAIVGCASYTLLQQQFQINDYNIQKSELNKKIAIEKETAAKLSKQKQNMNSDQAIESIARDKLGFVKPDEKKFIDSSH